MIYKFGRGTGNPLRAWDFSFKKNPFDFQTHAKQLACLLTPSVSLLVGALGIEPSLHEPESCVLPVYYAPYENFHLTLNPSLHPMFVFDFFVLNFAFFFYFFFGEFTEVFKVFLF